MGRGNSDELVILDLIPAIRGWQPIKHLIGMMRDTFGARVITPRHQEPPSMSARLSHRTLTRRRVKNAPSLLVVAPKADGIKRIRELPDWRNSYGMASAWIIDSFFSDALAPSDGFRHFDHIFVSWGGNIPDYESVAQSPVTYLPWGTDALHLGRMSPTRRWDLVRLGRQPKCWDDDDTVQAILAEEGLQFQGRPPGRKDGNGYPELLSEYLGQTKFVMAHSNLVDGSRYTHPTREYLTARWTDAFACGTTVIGVQPKTDPLFDRVIPEAVVHLNSTDREAELPRIYEELRSWDPTRPERIRQMALRHFDWRWRLRLLAHEMQLPTARLNAELAEVEALLLDQGRKSAARSASISRTAADRPLRSARR